MAWNAAEIINNLKTAKFVEREIDNGIQIELAHLVGQVTFGDGMMYWAILGCEPSGEKELDHSDISGSHRYLLNYGRKAIKNNLRRIADETVARLEAGRYAKPLEG